MIGKLVSTGFRLATLPARLTFRSVRALAMTPAEASRLLADMRQASDQAVQELQGLLANVDADMTHKTAHFSAADKRLAAGKPAQGTVRLSAVYAGAEVAISVTDDGAGLNHARIRAKAEENGIILPDAKLSEQELNQLIFAPGFSTAKEVTSLSGRGVGMDVVKRTIEGLRGSIDVSTRPGQGSTMTLRLPLTLAIIDGMLVGVGEDRYIIPTLSIRESFRPQPGMVSTIQGRGEVVSVRGRQTPLLRLGRYLGRPTRAASLEDAIIVVVESGEAARGLVVDELLGNQEVVIKSLGQTFRHQNLLAGSAVLGDGSVVVQRQDRELHRIIGIAGSST